MCANLFHKGYSKPLNMPARGLLWQGPLNKKEAFKAGLWKYLFLPPRIRRNQAGLIQEPSAETSKGPKPKLAKAGGIRLESLQLNKSPAGVVLPRAQQGSSSRRFYLIRLLSEADLILACSHFTHPFFSFSCFSAFLLAFGGEASLFRF